MSGSQHVYAQQAVACVNCSTVFWDAAHEVWEGAQWLRSLEQQILQVKYEILGWVEAVKTTAALPFRIFADATGTVREIQGVVQEAAMTGQNVKFMIDHLGSPYGWGGSIDDIPAALAQEDRAISFVMQRMGVAMARYQSGAADYSQRLATYEAQDVSGPTQAAMVANQIAATRGQQEAAQALVANSAFQALATAELRRAHREAMIQQKVAQNQDAMIRGACAQMTVIRPPVCNSGTGGAMIVASQ